MRYKFIILSVLVVLVAACAPIPELRNDLLLRDTGLITGEPCEAPCWQTIVPGETLWGQALDLLAANTSYTGQDRTRSRDSDEVVLSFGYQDGPQCCRLYTRDGEIVSSILLLMAPEMKLEQVLERYGEPQYLHGEDLTSDQTFVSLVYPDVPMIVYAFVAGIESGELTAQSEIIGAVMMTADEMQLLLDGTSLYNWSGYGALKTMLDGEFDWLARTSETQ
jgi:hypothetical protein